MSYSYGTSQSQESSSSGSVGSDGSLGAENSVAQAALPSSYTVQAGDTLSTIAAGLTGDTADYVELYEANTDQLRSPNLILPGQVLVVPEAWRPEAEDGGETEPAPAPAEQAPAPVVETEAQPAEIPAGEEPELVDALFELGESAWEEIEETVEQVATDVVDLWEEVGETVSGWWGSLFGEEEGPSEQPEEIGQSPEDSASDSPLVASLEAHPGLEELLAAHGTSSEALATALQGQDQASLDAILDAPTGEAATSTSTGPAIEADIGEHRGNRARPLDYDATNYTGITSEAPEAGVGDTLDETFDRHFDELLAEEFGEDVSLEQVSDAMHLAEALGLDATHASLEAALFRVQQYAAVETLDVEDSDRYAPTSSATYCNIYAYDLVSALGGYIPRTWWYDRTLQQIEAGTLQPVTVEAWDARVAEGQSTEGLVRPVYGDTVHELNANALNDWFDEHGADFGWTEAADMSAAQEAANAGSIVVITAANQDSGSSGHISVILAETDEHEAHRNEDGSVEAPLQSQAGSSNFKHDDNASSSGTQWWENSSHTNGAAWIFQGSRRSTLLTPEQLGL